MALLSAGGLFYFCCWTGIEGPWKCQGSGAIGNVGAGFQQIARPRMPQVVISDAANSRSLERWIETSL
jgi:hypothetical protein